jgi:hypothetical protein
MVSTGFWPARQHGAAPCRGLDMGRLIASGIEGQERKDAFYQFYHLFIKLNKSSAQKQSKQPKKVQCLR